MLFQNWFYRNSEKFCSGKSCSLHWRNEAICDLCNAKFTAKRNLNKHIASVHEWNKIVMLAIKLDLVCPGLLNYRDPDFLKKIPARPLYICRWFWSLNLLILILCSTSNWTKALASTQWCVLTNSSPLGVGQAPVENSWGTYKIKNIAQKKLALKGTFRLIPYLHKKWSLSTMNLPPEQQKWGFWQMQKLRFLISEIKSHILKNSTVFNIL